MRLNLGSISIVAAALAVSACGGPRKILVVKSEPSDAEVCIKGKGGSRYFSNQKQCVGTTPFEADRVSIVDTNGERSTVKFRDLEKANESFYVVVNHKGYLSQTIEVPGWEHLMTLKQETQLISSSATTPSASTDSKAKEGPAESNQPELPKVVAPSDPEADLQDNALLFEANNLYYQGKVNESLRNIEELLKRNPSNVRGLTMKGSLLRVMGQEQLAVAAWRKASELAPNNAELRELVKSRAP